MPGSQLCASWRQPCSTCWLPPLSLLLPPTLPALPLQAVEWACFGVFWTGGQICSSTSRLLVHEVIAPAFFAQLKRRAECIKVRGGGRASRGVPAQLPAIARCLAGCAALCVLCW